MSIIEGKVKTLFSDKEKTKAVFPRTKLSAISDENNIGLEALLKNLPYYSDKDEVDAAVAPVNADTLGGINAEQYATEDFVVSAINQAKIDGGDGNAVDLSIYATKADLETLVTKDELADVTIQHENDFTHFVTTYATEGKVSALASEVDTKLSKNGDTFGANTVEFKTPDSTGQISLQTPSASQGGGLWLYGNDYPEAAKAGRFCLQTYDAANGAYRALSGYPDGNLYWNSGLVYTEKNKPKLSDLGAASNPNLVENWYWKKPVNQRGGVGYTGEEFTIDRWRLSLHSTTGGVEIEDGYVCLHNDSTASNANTCALIHRFENPSKFAGKQVTVSVKFKKFAVNTSEQGPRIVFRDSGSSYVARTGYLSNLSLDDKIYTWTTTLPDTITTYLDLAIGNLNSWGGRGNIDFRIEAVKVEFGAVSTLEHDLISDNYDYAAELLKCQRFFVNYTAASGQWLTGATNGTTVYASLQLPTEMYDGVSATVLADYTNGAIDLYPFVSGGSIEVTGMGGYFGDTSRKTFMVTANHAKDATNIAAKTPVSIRLKTGDYGISCEI